MIFSTLQPDQIDLARVNAAGVIDLKNYLDFAIRGPKALVEQSTPTGMEPDSPFEVAVIRALREKGWAVHPQVGCSGYRIDIGVVDPRAPGRYLMGVECDGRSYHSGATARDRDRLRQLVLEGLGWKLHRIWSTDWWTDHQRELDKLHAILESMAQASVNQTPASVVAPAVQLAPEAPATQQPVFTPAVEPATAPAITAPIYRPTVLSGGDPEAFYQPASAKILSAQILDVANREGPISEEVLFRKLARAWGLERTGPRITERLRELAPPEVKVTNAGGVRFYWPPTVNPDEWTGFRGSDGSEPSRRHVEEVAVQEIANLAAFLLDQGGSTSPHELAKSICRTIGMARTPADAQNRALLGITHLVQSGRAIIESERVRLQR